MESYYISCSNHASGYHAGYILLHIKKITGVKNASKNMKKPKPKTGSLTIYEKLCGILSLSIKNI